MTLKSQRAADVSVLLNEDDFAESCTYYPKDGDARTVVANVDEDASDAEALEGRSRSTVIEILVSRDAETGIDNPQLGDGLVREGEEDGFGFTGEKKEVCTGTWLLTFARKLWVKRGGHRMQR